MSNPINSEETARIKKSKVRYGEAPLIHGSYSNLGKPEDRELTRKLEERMARYHPDVARDDGLPRNLDCAPVGCRCDSESFGSQLLKLSAFASGIAGATFLFTALILPTPKLAFVGIALLVSFCVSAVGLRKSVAFSVFALVEPPLLFSIFLLVARSSLSVGASTVGTVGGVLLLLCACQLLILHHKTR
jgi:hypothetical protein